MAGVSDDSRPLGANKTLRLRTRTRRVSDTGHVTVLENSVAWDPRRTALINCDMWNTNTCASAVQLSLELAPPMNQVMREARALGVLVIHAPSGVVGFYAGTPQRERAERAPQAENFPPAMDRWCGLQRDRDLDFPIEVDGCNCTPTCDLKGVRVLRSRRAAGQRHRQPGRRRAIPASPAAPRPCRVRCRPGCRRDRIARPRSRRFQESPKRLLAVGPTEMHQVVDIETGTQAVLTA